MRLKVSRHEMPASTRILVVALCTMAQFPRLPLASTETVTPMGGSLPLIAVETGVPFGLSGTLEQSRRANSGRAGPRRSLPALSAHARCINRTAGAPAGIYE